MADEQKNIVKKLTELLKENGMSVLMDGTPLCLNVSFLQFLNQSFSMLVDDDFGTSFEALPGSSTEVPLCQDLQFLYDFIQKTPKLKLISDAAMRKEAVSVAPFRSLRQLELKHVPSSMVTSLDKLRRKLEVLVCSHCLHRLEDILECRETDSGSTLMWTQLTTLLCSYNNITELDNSLRLLPVIEVLNLSHNIIYDADNYLEHLTELRSLDLSFNLLSIVPSLSLSCCNKLKQLSLRHNQLENVEGLEQLQSLSDLDIAYNCLALHHLLWPLRELQKLKMLMLEGNPLSYHARHRILTVEQLHPKVVKQLVLDRRKLTSEETFSVKQHLVADPPSPLPRQLIPIPRERASLQGDLCESNDDGNSFSTQSLPDTQQDKRIHRRKKHRKPRTVEIRDAEDITTETNIPKAETEHENELPADNKTLDHTKQSDCKKEIEIIRTQLGPVWLQALTISRESANPVEPIVERTNQTTASVAPTTEMAEDSTADENASTSVAAAIQSEEHLSVDEEKAYSDNEVNTPISFVSCEPADVSTDVADSPAVSCKAEENHTNNGFSWSKTESVDVDYGPESEPFIVRLLGGDRNEHFLITVTKRYLLEKDIEGNIMEALDQRCLKRVEITAGDVKASTKGCEALTLVRLYFDYYKRDKSERCYVMEDQQSAEALSELLQPAVELYEMSEVLQNIFQCLKCNTEFCLSENEKKSSLAKTGGYICPKCKSDMTIELDMGQISRSVGQNRVMPFDRQSDDPSSFLPEPSAQSTPVKSQHSDRLIYMESPSGSVKSESVQRSSPYKVTPEVCSNSWSARSIRRSLEMTPDTMVADSGLSSARLTTPARQVSESSDIVVLDEKRQSLTSMNSDTAILSGISESVLSPIHDASLDHPPGAPDQKQASPAEITPCGSLSEKTIHSMVSSIYENTFTSLQDSNPFVSAEEFNEDHVVFDNDRDTSCRDHDDNLQDVHETETPHILKGPLLETNQNRMSSTDLELDPDHVRFSYTDYSFIDHRLKLYLSLEVIGADEELCFLLQCDVVSLEEPVGYQGIFVVTNTKLYVFSTELPLSAAKLSKCLKLKSSGNLSTIQYIEQGYAAMCFYLMLDKVQFAFLVRDAKRTTTFVRMLADHLQKISPTPKFVTSAIKTEQVTAKNVISEVLSIADSDTDTDTDIRQYIMCHQQVGSLESGDGDLAPVSVIVSPSHIAMVTEAPDYVLRALRDRSSRSAGGSSSRDRKQFGLKDLQNVTDVSSIEIQSSSQQAVSLTFSEEGSQEECTWRLIMSTPDTRETFIATVKELWEELFGVELTCKYT